LKSLLVLSRSVEHTVETEVVRNAVKEPILGSKVQILRLLATSGSQTSSQVARFLGVSKPAVTQLIDGMVRRRLVQRRTARHDRREINLSLTEKGKRTYQAIHRKQRDYLKNVLGQASKADAQRWVNTLREVTDAVVRTGRAFDPLCLQCTAHADKTCVLDGGVGECTYAECMPFGDNGSERRPRARRNTRKVAANSRSR
jgi:DNA-binding MarR family transcriptional regulator